MSALRCVLELQWSFVHSVHYMNTTEREDDHTLGVLRAVSEESNLSQRRLARHLNVALGLANSYLMRCVRKGWVKVHQVPGNRYLYYLTPRGFAEKGRLTARYLSKSMSFYRQAGQSCLEALQACADNQWKRIALVGRSDLTEIAVIRKRECDVQIIGIVDSHSNDRQYLGHPVYTSAGEVPRCQAWIVTDLQDPVASWKSLCAEVDEDRVIVPGIIDWRPLTESASQQVNRNEC